MSHHQRNDPCPCGSGKKYKKCCLSRDQAAIPRTGAAGNQEHFIAEIRPDLDEAVDRVLQKMDEGAGRRVESEIATLLKDNPGYHMTQYAMGVYRVMVMKDPVAAIPFFEKAVKIFPPFPEAHYNLGQAALQNCNIPRAVEAFRAAISCSDDDDGVGALARKQLQWLEKTVLKGTTFPTLDAYVENERLFDQAFRCLCDREFEQALDLFRRVLVEYPDHVQTHGNMALACAGLGRKSEAMACIDRALELDPGYQPAITNRRAISQMREGEPFQPGAIMEQRYYVEQARRSKVPGDKPTLLERMKNRLFGR